VTGTFVHQNTLGMMVNLAVMAPVALEVAGRGSRLTRLAVIAAVPVCILTISRGALLFFGGGVVLVYLASATRAFTWRKAKLGLVGLALAAVVVPLALAELGSRPEVERVESMETRAQFERAASLMLQEHPLGIGPNHFTLRLLTSYGERAGVDWTQRLAIVHDVYTLTAAEMGYAGVVALALLFVAPLLTAVRAIRRAGRDPRGDLLVGLAVTLAVFYAHGLFEWAWRQTPVSYLYWMIVAVTESVARQLRAERATRRHAEASTVRPSAAAAVLAPFGA
jgi:O-antigen ligase